MAVGKQKQCFRALQCTGCRRAPVPSLPQFPRTKQGHGFARQQMLPAALGTTHGCSKEAQYRPGGGLFSMRVVPGHLAVACFNCMKHAEKEEGG